MFWISAYASSKSNPDNYWDIDDGFDTSTHENKDFCEQAMGLAERDGTIYRLARLALLVMDERDKLQTESNYSNNDNTIISGQTPSMF